MQGFILKIIVVSFALCSAALAASTTQKTILSNSSSSNQTASFNSGAGCMGCHQGETLSMASNETSENTRDYQRNKAQKKNLPQKISKG